MFFRNLTLFRFPTSLNLADLDAQLAECELKPVGALELSSRGFVTPLGQHGDQFCQRQGDALWLAIGGEDKLLPGAVVNDLLQKKLASIEEKEGRKPGGRTRKRLKDELIMELLPRAFVRPVRTDALIDTQTGVIAVDTSSRKSAESVVSEVRRALGSFPALPLNAEVAPRAILTGDECELRDPTDTGAVVKIQRMELSGEEIRKHLEAGKQATRLALTLDDHVNFVLGEDLIVRKFKLLDGAVDQLEASDSDDIVAELGARFALMAGEFKRLFNVLEAAFKLSKAE